ESGGSSILRMSEKSSTDIVVKWEFLGALKIMKVGENREDLKGAVFEVVSENGDFRQEITTTENGSATLNKLPTGTYIVKEIQAPEGYVLDPTIKKMEVKTGVIAEIEIKNQKITSGLEIKKVDATYESAKQSYDIQSKEHTMENDLASKEKHRLPSTGTKFPTVPFVGLGLVILGIYILKIGKNHS
ncbi:MSCRAMM family protein, partial [Bacillus mycoides]|uniref:MSCRAMM family protein n=1 Tax=Bacillus mycoides TaxID=1405 RepID=UPI003D211B76